jgi:thiaminase
LLRGKYAETEFTERFWNSAQPLWEKVTRHPFIKAVKKGEAPKLQLKVFTKQGYCIVRETVRLGALAVASCPDLLSQASTLSGVQEEIGHERLAMRFGVYLGLTEKQVKESVPLPGTSSLINYFYRVLSYGETAEKGVAIAVVNGAFSEAWKQMLQGLRREYKVPEKSLEYFKVHVGEGSDLLCRGMELASDYAANDTLAERAVHTGLEGLRLQLSFWDDIAASK